MNIPVNEPKGSPTITISNSDAVGDALPTMINLIRQADLRLGHITHRFEHNEGTVAITCLESSNTKGELGLLWASLRCQLKFITLKKLLNERSIQFNPAR